MTAFFRLLLLSGCAACVALPAAALAQSAATAPVGELTLRQTGIAADLNPTARIVTLTVPVRNGSAYLGDIIVEIDPDDTVRMPAARLIELLAPVLERNTLDTLRTGSGLSEAELLQAGVSIRYNPQDLAVDVEIAGNRMATRSIEVSPLSTDLVGDFIAPARFSGYLNVRGNVDYLHDDAGLQTPIAYLDGALRFGGIVAEGEGFWQPGSEGRDFYRVGSRLVHDDRERLVRWTAGDLQPVGRGFQSLPEISGLSVFRTYGILEPQRIARPRGDRAFTLLRPSTVEVEVNGQVLRRLELGAGNYDLRDFPFAQGSNDVRLVIIDDVGQREVLRFNIFFDQSQLEPGLTEFGLYAGVLSPSGRFGPDYSDEFAASGFIRRGLSNRLTVGANIQGDGKVQMGGAEALWSTPIGTLGTTLALSRNERHGTGHAVTLTFQRLISRAASGSDSLNLFLETRSEDFSVLGTLEPRNPFRWETGGGYSRGLGPNLYAGIDGRYSRGRGDQPDVWHARGSMGYRLSDTINVSADVRWEKDGFGRQLSGLLTATTRFGPFSSLRADYDTRFDRARLSWSTFRGQGVGAYNISADIDRSDDGSGVNVAANYFANRAELGFSHYGNFENTFGESLSQRSSVRFGTSLALADGAFSVGRPIYDSFAIVRGHPSLDGASIEIEPTPLGRTAETGALGVATHPNLPAFLSRTIVVDAPDAPATADLGQGSFRVLPPYRGGYVLTVGSAYNVSATGRLLMTDGSPLSLATGTATLQGKSDGPEPIVVFTNREGRFGITGLGAGRWLVRMDDESGSTFTLDISEDTEGVISVGELRPAAATQQDAQ